MIRTSGRELLVGGRTDESNRPITRLRPLGESEGAGGEEVEGRMRDGKEEEQRKKEEEERHSEEKEMEEESE